MQNLNAACPNCGYVYESAGDREYEVCARCHANYRAESAVNAFAERYAQVPSPDGRAAAVTEAEDMFLSGSSFLALKKYESAAELFLSCAKLCPSNPKYWLYLLASVTERFRLIHLFADEKAMRKAGQRKVICKNVYKNFVATAKKDDYIFAKSEFGVDLDPKTGELWEFVQMQIIRKDDLPFDLAKAAELAEYADDKLMEVGEEIAKRYHEALCRKLNPIREGVLEVNTLRFYPDSPDGILRIDTDADMIEFASDNMSGAERFKAFLLTRNVENIGTHFPFTELVVDKGVTKIPDKLMNFCGGIQRLTLSDTVKVIGKGAFIDCINLRYVSSLSSVEEIGEKAFYGTSVRVLELSGAARYLGREVLGIKSSRSDGVEIEKYLIKLDARAAENSPGFNVVGEHKCGYLVNDNGEHKLVYPIKSVGGSVKSLTGDEKMIFKALAYAALDGEAPKSGLAEAIDKTKGFFSGLFKRK